MLNEFKFKRAIKTTKAVCGLPVFKCGVGLGTAVNQTPHAHSLNFVGHKSSENHTGVADFSLAGHSFRGNHSQFARLTFPATIVVKPCRLLPEHFYLGHNNFQNLPERAQVS